MSRKQAREFLFKMIFELCFINPEQTETYENFLKDEEVDQENKQFIQTIYVGVVNNMQYLQEEIAKHIKGYTLERLFKIDLSILLLAFYEIMFYKETPATVVVNEAVELAKKYSTEKSYGFINAVLASLLKSLK